MGPQLDSCGRRTGGNHGVGLGKLQWGRNLIVAEGKVVADTSRDDRLLQWGRNLIVAEGRCTSAC